MFHPLTSVRRLLRSPLSVGAPTVHSVTQSTPLKPWMAAGAIALGLWGGAIAPATATAQSAVGRAVAFSCQESQNSIRQKGAPVVAFGTSRIYIGYQQVSSTNKNPIMVRFNNGQRVWCRTNYEMSGDDGEGYGLLWNGGSVLYGVFSATGTQGNSSQDYRRFTSQGWLSSYGNGGGPKASVILRINPNTGIANAGTFVTSQLSNGRTNSFIVRSLAWNNSRLVVRANAWFSPRRPNRQPMSCSGSSPFDYRLVLTANLRRAVTASADRCS